MRSSSTGAPTSALFFCCDSSRADSPEWYPHCDGWRDEEYQANNEFTVPCDQCVYPEYEMEDYEGDGPQRYSEGYLTQCPGRGEFTVRGLMPVMKGQVNNDGVSCSTPSGDLRRDGCSLPEVDYCVDRYDECSGQCTEEALQAYQDNKAYEECRTYPGFQNQRFIWDGPTTVPVLPCDEDTTGAASCKNTVGSFSCSCPDDFDLYEYAPGEVQAENNAEDNLQGPQTLRLSATETFWGNVGMYADSLSDKHIAGWGKCRRHRSGGGEGLGMFEIVGKLLAPLKNLMSVAMQVQSWLESLL